MIACTRLITLRPEESCRINYKTAKIFWSSRTVPVLWKAIRDVTQRHAYAFSYSKILRSEWQNFSELYEMHHCIFLLWKQVIWKYYSVRTLAICNELAKHLRIFIFLGWFLEMISECWMCFDVLSLWTHSAYWKLEVIDNLRSSTWSVHRCNYCASCLTACHPVKYNYRVHHSKIACVSWHMLPPASESKTIITGSYIS